MNFSTVYKVPLEQNSLTTCLDRVVEAFERVKATCPEGRIPVVAYSPDEESMQDVCIVNSPSREDEDLLELATVALVGHMDIVAYTELAEWDGF